MADQAEIITQTRVIVHDPDPSPPEAGRPLYSDDPAYLGAISRGLMRINLDLRSTYTVSDLPTAYEVFLIYRTSIEMCLIRGGEGASSDIAETVDNPIQSVSVPNLSIAKFGKSNQGPIFWSQLAADLERQYLAMLESIMDTGAIAGNTIIEAVLSRRSLRTGKRTAYYADSPITAPLFSVSEASGVVSLSWESAADQYFDYYHVHRSATSDFAVHTVLTTVADVHEVTYEDDPEVGTWYYRLEVENSNGLVSYSVSGTATVA